MNVNVRRAALVAAFAAVAAVVAPAQAGAAPAEPGGPPCDYSVTAPTQLGRHVWGQADWTCDLSSSVATEIHVRILRDGEVLKEAVFRNDGPVRGTFTTAVPCVGPEYAASFTVQTYGWDGSGPYAYTGKESDERRLACG